MTTHTWYFLSFDYNQIELRVMAHESQDAELLRVFRAGEDAHAATAAEMFQISLDQVSPEQRRTAKSINFGVIYDIQGEGLYTQFEQEAPGLWSLEQCYRFIKSYHAAHPGVVAYKERVKAQARWQGYVSDMFGRRRWVPEIHSRRPKVRADGERIAINSPIQMGAQSIIRRAMGEIWAWEQRERLVEEVRPVLQMHDELVFEVEEDRVELAKERVARLMVGVVELDVPIVVSVKMGRRLGELE